MKTYKTQRNIFLGVALLGMILLIIPFFVQSLDERVSAAGGMLFAVGIARVLMLRRTRGTPERMKQFEIQQKDERLRFIGHKAIQWTFWISIYVELAAGVVCADFLRDPFLNRFGTIVCLFICAQLLLYVILYHVFERKY